jgi:hypothetical protein
VWDDFEKKRLYILLYDECTTPSSNAQANQHHQQARHGMMGCLTKLQEEFLFNNDVNPPHLVVSSHEANNSSHGFISFCKQANNVMSQ